MVLVQIESTLFLASPEELRRVPVPSASGAAGPLSTPQGTAPSERNLFHAVCARGAYPHVLFQRGSAPHATDADAESALTMLRTAVAAETLAVVQDEGPGWALVSLDESAHPEDTAIAVAVVKARLGWDDANPMDVVVDDARFRVDLSLAGDACHGSAVLHPVPAQHHHVDRNIRQSIRDRARRARSEFPSAPTDIRELVRLCQVLPLTSDADGLYALRHDGSVVKYDWEETVRAKREGTVPIPAIEASSRVRDTMLYAGAKTHTFLEPLLPPKPREARPCPLCRGDGTAAPRNLVSGVVRCWCGGLGWVPDHWEPPDASQES